MSNDVEVSTEDLGGLGGGLGEGRVIIIEDLTHEQAMANIRGTARYVSFSEAVNAATDDPTKDNLDHLAEVLSGLIQDERTYKGRDAHALIMSAKLRSLFDLMAK